MAKTHYAFRIEKDDLDRARDAVEKDENTKTLTDVIVSCIKRYTKRQENKNKTKDSK